MVERVLLRNVFGHAHQGNHLGDANNEVLRLTAYATRVLFVEDDENYREIVSDELAHHGFAVRSFVDGDSLLGSLDSATEADVIVLDWKLPGISGIDLLPELRQHGVNLPVVILTGRALTADEECLAFERGAVDFIDKTRGVEVLISRLRLAAEAGKPGLTLLDIRNDALPMSKPILEQGAQAYALLQVRFSALSQGTDNLAKV